MITQSRKTVKGIDLKTPKLLEPPPRVTVGTQPSKLYVVCVWWGTAYSKKYVEHLRNSIKRNLSIPYTFFCLTDHKSVKIDDVVMLPILDNSTKTWWAKVCLFRPQLFDKDARILYLDLDVVVTGSLNTLACVQEPFCMIENYGPNKGHAAHNSSVMVWTPTPETDKIFTQFSPDVMKELHGDQCYIWRVRRDNIHDYPKNWVVSYKYEKHSQWHHADKDTCVYVFHGEPKPHKVKDAIIKRNWV